MEPAATYTLPGVLNFLTHEFRRFERERAMWEAERATWQARVAVLEGEKQALENLQKDMERRTLMLQNALRQERASKAAGKGGSTAGGDGRSEVGPGETGMSYHGKVATVRIPKLRSDEASSDASQLRIERSRSILRRYLEELGLENAMIRAPVGASVAAAKTTAAPAPATAASAAGAPASTQPPKGGTGGKGGQTSASAPSSKAGGGVGGEAELAMLQVDEQSYKAWRPRFTLRNHLDSVRAVAFHEQEPALVSASEDCTLKLWNLRHLGGVGGGRQGGSTDIEPVFTFRGHRGPIFSVLLDSDNGLVYSAGADASLRSWRLPDLKQARYASYGSATSQKLHTYHGHHDAVWDLALHPFQRDRLMSISADATVKLWSVGASDLVSAPLWSTTRPRSASSAALDVPTACDFVPSDGGKCIVAFRSGKLVLFDVETGAEISEFAHNADASGGPDTQANDVAVHPTLPWVMSAHENKQIRFFDINSGGLIQAITGHPQAVSALDVDASGLNLVSVGHDSSVRFWSIESRHCLHEISLHRKKHQESINDVALHPTLRYCATAGADGNIKLLQ